MVLYFASSRYEPAQVAAAMQAQFPQAVTVGCTTAGEIVSGAMLRDSVVAMAFNPVALEEVAWAVVKDLTHPADLDTALAQLAAHYDQPLQTLDFEQYVGLILIDGLSGAEERVMDRIGDKTDVIFIGASAGDDLKFAQTHVFANGQAYANAALLILLKPGIKFDFIKTQSFAALEPELVATQVNEAQREVLEFNHQPAVVAYAQALQVSPEALGTSFASHPLGLMVGDEPYVRSPQQVAGDGVKFYCGIKEGMALRLLQSGDIVADTRQALLAQQEKRGPISALINFHCILRTLELEQKNQTEAYGQLFSQIPTIGFSTYGEEYIGHVNQTSTMLVFRE